MKKLFTLVTLALTAISGAWADETISISFPYDKINATGTGTVSVDAVIENTSVALTGTNVSLLSFNGTGTAATYNSIAVPAYSKVKVSNDGTSGNNDGIRFTITPAEGCTFTPTSISLGAIREGTDAGSMYVYANGTALNEATLAKSSVTPGRNKTGTNYTKDGYSFSYNVSEVTATPESPLTIDVCMTGLKNKSWGVSDVVITGTYTKVAVTTYALTTTADPAAGGEITRSPNAAAYSAGKSVTLTATPNYGYEFVNWTKGGVEQGTDATLNITTAAAEEEYVAHFNAQTTYALTVNADANGSVAKSPNHDAYLVGEEVTLTATPDEGYYFVNWTDDNNSDAEVSTSAAYAYTTTAAAASFTAHFAKLFNVTYDIDDYNGTTTKALTNFSMDNNINEKYADKDGSYLIPTYSHYYMYREGYVFSKWEDQDGNQYEKGTTINGITKDIVLTPVWVATTQSLENSSSETTVTWNLGKSTILFNGWQNAPQVGYYTKPHTINGELIAVPMIVNTTSGKVDNSTRSDALAQVNGGTTFTIPAINGMTVVLTANSNITNTTVAGNTPSEGSGTKEATYNYTGENGTAIIDIKDGSYYSKIKVTYPKMAESVSISSAGYATLYSESALEIPTGVKAYTGKVSGNNLVLSEVTTTIPAETAVVLEAEEGTYFFTKTTSAAFEGENDLKGVLADTPVDANSVLVLGYEDSEVGFYTFSGTTLAAGKAYLEMPASGAPAIYFSFEDETEVTGVYNLRVEEKANAAFDLTGRRANGKGLMIQNGKVVLVK